MRFTAPLVALPRCSFRRITIQSRSIDEEVTIRSLHQQRTEAKLLMNCIPPVQHSRRTISGHTFTFVIQGRLNSLWVLPVLVQVLVLDLVPAPVGE